jgi:hypothetical protein
VERLAQEHPFAGGARAASIAETAEPRPGVGSYQEVDCRVVDTLADPLKKAVCYCTWTMGQIIASCLNVCEEDGSWQSTRDCLNEGAEWRDWVKGMDVSKLEKKIVRLRRNGKSWREIAKAVKCSHEWARLLYYGVIAREWARREGKGGLRGRMCQDFASGEKMGGV